MKGDRADGRQAAAETWSVARPVTCDEACADGSLAVDALSRAPGIGESPFGGAAMTSGRRPTWNS